MFLFFLKTVMMFASYILRIQSQKNRIQYSFLMSHNTKDFHKKIAFFFFFTSLLTPTRRPKHVNTLNSSSATAQQLLSAIPEAPRQCQHPARHPEEPHFSEFQVLLLTNTSACERSRDVARLHFWRSKCVAFGDYWIIRQHFVTAQSHREPRSVVPGRRVSLRGRDVNCRHAGFRAPLTSCSNKEIKRLRQDVDGDADKCDATALLCLSSDSAVASRLPAVSFPRARVQVVNPQLRGGGGTGGIRCTFSCRWFSVRRH